MVFGGALLYFMQKLVEAILSQPSADSSLCGGSLLEGTRAKPPLKGEVPAKRAEGFRPLCRKDAAALSAAVTTCKHKENAPNLHGRVVGRKDTI